jgi:hypothetical protein
VNKIEFHVSVMSKKKNWTTVLTKAFKKLLPGRFQKVLSTFKFCTGLMKPLKNIVNTSLPLFPSACFPEVINIQLEYV